jgi:hypothetical protein
VVDTVIPAARTHIDPAIEEGAIHLIVDQFNRAEQAAAAYLYEWMLAWFANLALEIRANIARTSLYEFSRAR